MIARWVMEPAAGRAKRELAWIFLRIGDEIRGGADVEVLAYRDHLRGRPQLRERHHVAHDVVNLGPNRRQQSEGGDATKQQSVSVMLAAEGGLGADQSGTAGAVLDDHRLAQLSGQRLGEQTSRSVA